MTEAAYLKTETGDRVFLDEDTSPRATLCIRDSNRTRAGADLTPEEARAVAAFLIRWADKHQRPPG